MAHIIAITNQKGGVGKTTTAVNLAACLSALRQGVLLIDLDPQGNATMGCGVDKHTVSATSYDVLVGEATLADALQWVEKAQMRLLPANGDLTAAEVNLLQIDNAPGRLREALAPVVWNFDVILIDCPPSLNMLTVNALTASDGVIVPLECEYFALRGVALLKTTIDKVQERLNPRLVVDGVLGTMFDGRTLHGREVMQRLVEAWGDQVFHTVIRRTVKFSDSTVAGEPITSYASGSTGADAYRQLAREVAARCLDA